MSGTISQRKLNNKNQEILDIIKDATCQASIKFEEAKTLIEALDGTVYMRKGGSHATVDLDGYRMTLQKPHGRGSKELLKYQIRNLRKFLTDIGVIKNETR